MFGIVTGKQSFLYAGFASAVAADVLIAMSLCVSLSRRRTGFKRCVGMFPRMRSGMRNIFQDGLSSQRADPLRNKQQYVLLHGVPTNSLMQLTQAYLPGQFNHILGRGLSPVTDALKQPVLYCVLSHLCRLANGFHLHRRFLLTE